MSAAPTPITKDWRRSASLSSNLIVFPRPAPRRRCGPRHVETVRIGRADVEADHEELVLRDLRANLYLRSLRTANR